ncbi:response regulator [bacterium SCSIO 12741]|nr:response regulator [bacterium SCSIO 12741]
MSKIKILIVEDDFLIQEDLALKLESSGYEVLDKLDRGEDAIVSVSQNEPDIILMDIQLAGEMDGIQTASTILANHSLPLIYLTDYSDKKTIDRAGKTKPSSYILKPFNTRQLLISIEIALQNFEADRVFEPERKYEDLDAPKVFKDSIFIKGNLVHERIRIKDILYLEADRSYSILVTEKRSYQFSYPLKALLDKFPSQSLTRVSKKHAVNLNQVDGIKGNNLMLREHEIPVAKSHKEIIKNLYLV